MEKSETITSLAKALIDFNGRVSKITKDAKNPFFKSNYASLSNIQDAISKPLADSGLTYSQMPTGVNGLCTILIHAESGEYLMDSFIMPVSKPNDPQAVGSAITYAKRYALAGILGLNIDDDDDGNKAAEKPDAPVEKPWLNPNTDKWASVLIAMKNGYTLDVILKKYKISKENETKLLNELEIAQ
jgi:predicted RNA-binding protein with PUA-like domain